ncbi:DUF2142 domain-containing protein [Streptomyces globosus]|uniref:DUF2142 domain-containing protein n=1 Tax=Streptomyces globosus TaxID=68209 RepID=UPI0037FC113C
MISALTRLADRAARSPKRLWAVSFALFFTLAASWSAATPLGGSPDEHAHLIRAAAVARGQINGPEVMVPHVVGGIEGKFSETAVRLPDWYRQLPTQHECYSWDQEKPASCAPPLKGTGQTAQATTAAGRYHPAYYLATGWPSLFADGKAGLYLMRLLSAALCSALLASAVVTAAEWRRRRGAVLLGVFAAATPMSLYMTGMVNPSGGEIAAGMLVWTALLAVMASPDPHLLNRRLARIGIGGAVLVNIRPLGLIWFAGAVFFALLLQERGVLRSLLRRKATWLWSALLGVSTAGAMLWAAAHPDHSVISVPESLTWKEAVRQTLGNTMDYVHQMLGYFGWLDTPAPAFTWLAWLGVLAVLTALGLLYGRPLEVLALLGMLAAVVVVPVLGQASQAEKLGMIWQGRYLLPFAVGLPLMAVVIAARRAPEGGLPWRRLTGFAVAALAVADAAAFFWTLRRFAVGTAGPWIPYAAHWAPPGGWVLWVGVHTAAAFAIVLLALVRDPEPAARGRIPEQGGVPRSGQRERVPVAG